jgi:hypothetical protein
MVLPKQSIHAAFYMEKYWGHLDGGQLVRLQLANAHCPVAKKRLSKFGGQQICLVKTGNS